MKRESVKQQHITYNMKDVYWRGTHIIEVVFSRWHAMTRSPAEGEHHTTLALLRESRLGTAFSAQVFCTAQVISIEHSSFPLQFVCCFCPSLLFVLAETMCLYVYYNSAFASHHFPYNSHSCILFSCFFKL